MLLTLRSLYETTVQAGAGLLLALRSLVQTGTSGVSNLSFHITGVAADPEVGAIAEVTGTEESSGGIWPSLAERLRREAPKKKQFRISGVAADPAVGEIEAVDVSIGTECPPIGTECPSMGTLNIVHVDFGFAGAPQANAYAGRSRSRIAADFQIPEGVAAMATCAENAQVETAFDLTEDEWLGLMLAAA